MTGVLFVNGPPRVGKDVAGRLIRAHYDGVVRVDKFARILKERTHALYGLLQDGGRPLPHDYFEDRKDRVLAEFGGITPRAAYIAVSERLMKPLHGQDIFGKLLLRDVSGVDMNLLVITDSGFAAEAVPIIEHFGHQNCRLLRLHADGRDFSGDSRGYISLPGLLDYDLDNPMTLSGFTEALSTLFPHHWTQRATVH